MTFSIGYGRSRVPSLVVRFALAAALLFLGAANAVCAAPSPAALLVPVDRLIRGIDAGSAGTIAGAYVFAPTIVDEFAPFRWSGGAAATRWYRGFVSVAQSSALQHIRVIRHAPTYTAFAPGRAWLVIPTDYLYDVAGKAQRESAAWTFVLVSGGHGWRIEASTWAKTAGAP